MYGGMDATGGPFAKQARQLGLRAKVLSGDEKTLLDVVKM